jgi:hypothetical protein
MSVLEKKKKQTTKVKSKANLKKNGFPAHQFAGKVKFEGDPVEIQRQLRDEWEERLRRH